MGKASQEQLPVVARQRQGAIGTGCSRLFCCRRCSTALSSIVPQFNFKCVFFLILTVSVSIFALFSVVHINSKTSGYDAKDFIKIRAAIQASFRLQKPVSQLIRHITELEYDIFGEIGVPSTKVVILSMHPPGVSNVTNVVFGVLPNPPNIPINPVFSSLLQSSFIELFLQQSNLTLTNETFGQPASFEILKFPGGIRLIPEKLSPISQIPQILFNFSLNNSIQEIKDNIVELKIQLKLGLDLMPNENMYLQVKNERGSTINPPVVVEASVTSNIGYLLPQRLRVLAVKILTSHAKNLGLDYAIFGKVKEVRLSSALTRSLDVLPPTPSPSPSPSPAPTPSPAFPLFDSPAPAPNFDNSAPCFNFDTSALSDPSNTHAPSPQYQHQSSLPSILSSPAPSMVPKTHYHVSEIIRSSLPVSHIYQPDSDLSPPSASTPSPSIGSIPQISTRLSPIPVVSYGCDSSCSNENMKVMESPPHALP